MNRKKKEIAIKKESLLEHSISSSSHFLLAQLFGTFYKNSTQYYNETVSFQHFF